MNSPTAVLNDYARRLVNAFFFLSLLAGNFGIAPLHAQADEFPALTGRIVDLANLLDDATESALLASLATHEEATSNQVVILTLPSLNGNDIADYANRLGRFWELGTAEKNNGVLLVVAPNERKVRIEVGYGLEGALTDALSSIIIQREILPAFRQNNYSPGIQQGIAAILKAIEGEYTIPEDQSDDNTSSSPLEKILPLIFIAMVGIPEILRRSGFKKAANGAFPAGFGGLFATLASGSLLIGLGVALAVFLFIYFVAAGKNGSGGGGFAGGAGMGGGGFGSGGSFGGGGFSGGGGSFGGGGSSGSW